MRTLVSVVSFLLTIVSAIKPKTHLRDVYASSGELTSVFKMEQELVDILAKHKAETQDQLAAIKEYKEEVGIYFFLGQIAESRLVFTLNMRVADTKEIFADWISSICIHLNSSLRG